MGKLRQIPETDESHFLVGFTLVRGAHLDSHFVVESAEKGEQLVRGEATKVSVHQMGHVGLRNAQNTCDFGLLQFLFLEDFEDVESDLRTSHELVGIFQTKIRKNVS